MRRARTAERCLSSPAQTVVTMCRPKPTSALTAALSLWRRKKQARGGRGSSTAAMPGVRNGSVVPGRHLLGVWAGLLPGLRPGAGRCRGRRVPGLWVGTDVRVSRVRVCGCGRCTIVPRVQGALRPPMSGLSGPDPGCAGGLPRMRRAHRAPAAKPGDHLFGGARTGTPGLPAVRSQVPERHGCLPRLQAAGMPRVLSAAGGGRARLPVLRIPRGPTMPSLWK
jgi:hypothetical protein